MAGTVAGQLVSLMAMPLLTRLYDPTLFGHFGIFAGLVAIAGVALAGRLDLAIPIAPTNRAATTVLWVGVGVSLGAGFVITTVGLMSWPFLSGQPWFSVGLLFVGPASALMAANLVLTQYLLRERRYRSVASRNLAFQPAITVVQIAAPVLEALRTAGLPIGYVAGHAVATGVLYRGLPPHARRLPRMTVWRRLSLATLGRYRRLLVLSTPSAVLNAVGMQLPLLLLATAYGPAVAGYFTLTQRVLSAPIMLVGTALGQVYVSHLAGGVGPTTRAHFLRYSTALGVMALLLGTGLSFSEPLFAWFFGRDWSTAGTFAALMAPAFAMQFLASPLSVTVTVAQHLRLQLSWDVLRVCSISMTIIVAHQLSWAPTRAVLALALVHAAMYAALWVISFRATSAPPSPGRPPV